MPASAAAVALLTFAVSWPAAAAADDATARAREHYKVGLKLFEELEREQALVHFTLANEAKPSPDAVFMMAQCQYHLGDLKQARANYERYLEAIGSGDLADTARARIQAIERRPSTFVIQTDPDAVDVRLVGQAGAAWSGQAPNEFKVPRGRYRIELSKANHETRVEDIEIGLAETKPLFRKLEQTKALLEITTVPPSARLFVNGNLARNPYSRKVEPGRYEIYAEPSESPPEHEPLEVVLDLRPGERKVFDEAHDGALLLPYRQRSGKPELVAVSAAITAALGTGVVYASLSSVNSPTDPAPAALVAAGGLVGGLVGLVSTSVALPYIPDNKALFIIGGMWIGGAQASALTLTLDPDIWALLTGRSNGAELPPLLLGAAIGIGAGTLATVLLKETAPTYGRVALIHSASLIGLLSGALINTAFQLGDSAMGPSLLLGLNAGLGVGLAAAYLSDQSRYGPTWQRVILVDLAAGTGALAGAIAATVQGCIEGNLDPGKSCEFSSAPRAAQLTLIGGYVGLAVGMFVTRSYDRPRKPPPNASGARRGSPKVAFVPAPAALIVPTTRGAASLVPGIAASGRF